MNQQHIYEKIQQLIIDGKVPEAFAFLKEKQNSDTLAILESEYNELRKAEQKGILDSHQVQLKKNQVNDKLLAIAKEGKIFNLPTKQTGKKITSSNNLWKILIPVFALFLGGLFFWNNNSSTGCPSYSTDIRNKVLIIPFINVGDSKAQPHIGLRDRINKVSAKKELSIQAELGEADNNLTMNNAPKLALSCGADLIVWGTYEKSDSINLVVNYYFADNPQWNKTAELATLKNVNSIYKGQLTKHLENDVFLSLCSIIVARDGNNPLAKTWLDKVINKDEIDIKLLQVLN